MLDTFAVAPQLAQSVIQQPHLLLDRPPLFLAFLELDPPAQRLVKPLLSALASFECPKLKLRSPIKLLQRDRRE
ncbi:MAG: hypothetical protein ACREIV_01980 [Planctomycetaceae bacterium]